MDNEWLPELEHLVLLAVLHCGKEAYGVPVMKEIERRTGRRLLRPSVYEALRRLKAKGLVTTQLGEPTPVRGGRARTVYEVSDTGLAALRASNRAWANMWRGVEGMADET